MPPNELPSPVVVLPTTLVVESTVEPTAAVVPPTTLPTVEVVELTTPPTRPPDDELREPPELALADDALFALPAKRSSSLARALAAPLTTEVMVAAIGTFNEPPSRRSKRSPIRDSPLLLLFWLTSVTWPTSREPLLTTVRPCDL